MKRFFAIVRYTCFAGALLLAGVACTKNLRPPGALVRIIQWSYWGGQ